MTDYAAVLTALYPGTEWALNGDAYAGLTWLSDTPKPAKKTLDEAWPHVKFERERAAVEAARRARYQTETDGLFFEAQREGGDLTAWKAAVDAIKADLPYPTLEA